MNRSLSVFMAFPATITSIIWIVLFFFNHNKYKNILNTPAVKKYMLHDILFIGFGIMKLMNINVKGEKFTLKRSRIAEIYGIKYSEYYTYMIAGAQITYTATLLPAVLILAAVTENMAVGVLGIIMSGLMLIYMDFEIKKKVNQKHEEILSQLPAMISRLTLLVNAGMVLRDAWKKIAQSSDTTLCREMRQTSLEIQNGVSETEAFNAFADRCQTKEIRKFISSLSQNVKKGNSEMAESLKLIASEQWDEKKNSVKIKGESVNQKLLFPMLMIFVAIIIMIIVPIFVNII